MQNQLQAITSAVCASLLRQGHPVPTRALMYAILEARDSCGQTAFEASFDTPAADALPAQAAEALVLPGAPVPVIFYTDDRVFQVNFDARPWLMQADEALISAVIHQGYRGCEHTDAIAFYMGEKKLNPAMVEAFEYIDTVRQNPDSNLHFECRIDGRDMLSWLALNRTQVLANILCEEQGVAIVQAEEEEHRGMWDWLAQNSENSDVACAQSFSTADEARLDAYNELGLLAQFSGEIEPPTNMAASAPSAG